MPFNDEDIKAATQYHIIFRNIKDIYIHTYIYIYTHTHIHIYIYTYIHTVYIFHARSIVFYAKLERKRVWSET
jgi:hypothetical protein